MLHIQQTIDWIANFVIQLNLCPFARKPFQQEKIRYVLYEGTDLEELTLLLLKELNHLASTPAKKIETTFIIHPHLLQDFYAFNDYLEVTNHLIFAARLEGVLQIASFHPDYQFEGVEKDDVTNYTNRSPYPMLHLLREASIEYALEHYENPEGIPERNMEVMRSLGNPFFEDT